MATASALEFAKSNHERYLSELKEFLAIPTISTLPEHRADVQRGAEWLARQLSTNLGMQSVEIMPTGGHPVVYGEWLGAPGKPTVMIYGHYDVQPVDPIDDWTSPPFEPTIRGEHLYARGSSDMKGQAHAVLKALEAWVKSGGMPVNVKMFLEGEEEIGSPNLASFIDEHGKKLKCDVVLNTDSSILRPDLPSLVIGLRGLAYFEIWIRGPKSDLHSGRFGGSLHNPAQVLCELVAGMHDADGHVTLPGFYDKVRPLSKEARAEVARIPYSDEAWREMTGVPQLYGERGFTTLERIGVRPTLEVNGLYSGFIGEGSKTVLPAKAMAKVSMRLVPHQDPDEVEQQLREYLRRKAPPTVTWEVKPFSGAPVAIVDRNTPAIRAASAALEAAFGLKAVYVFAGGSVPVVNLLKTKLGLDSVLMGFGLPDDQIHGPNENLHLPTYYRGIEAYIRFFQLISQG
jgi:acetylornithine deacetylase/succinyl-diaminopimelate desuccinylase-like protein